MQRVTRGNLLTWYNSSQPINYLTTGGVIQNDNPCFIIARPSEQYSLIINSYLNNAEPLVLTLVSLSGTSMGTVGTLTREQIDTGLYINYGTITMPSNLPIGGYYLTTTAISGHYNPAHYNPSHYSTIVPTGFNLHSTPFYCVDAPFANEQTHLISFRNNYTIHNTPYPHLVNSTFRQSFRVLATRSGLEPVSERTEYRQPDGRLFTTNVYSSMRHTLTFQRCDGEMIEALNALASHNDIEIRGQKYLATTPPAVEGFSRGQLSRVTLTLEELDAAWAQSCARL